MKRLAVFVEGQTEQIFVAKLLTEIAGEKNIVIDKKKGIFGRRQPREFEKIEAVSKIDRQKYYILICDCANGEKVTSDITDQYNLLVNQGYERIVGLRDVYPKTHSDIPSIKSGLEFGLNNEIPNRTIPVSVILAIMEIEAWFLAETSHFSRIDQSLTLEIINRTIYFNPVIDNVENRPHPSQDLNDIYGIAGFRYTKRKANVQRTVNALDYGFLYLESKEKVESLGQFIKEIDLFLN